MKKIVLLLSALCLLLSGCGKDVPPPVTQAPTQATAPHTTEPATEAPTTAPEPVVTEITLSFTGDCTLGTNQKHSYENSFHEAYDDHGADYFLDKVRHIFREDDLTVVNLEGSLTNSKDLQEKLWNHKGPPEYVEILTGSSVEVATMGNNHKLDYGISGLEETEATLTGAGIGYCYDDVYLVKEVKGIKIGFVSVNYVYDGLDVIPFLRRGYESARQEGCQLVIACMHWGTGKKVTLDDHQLLLGCELIDMGYDLVVGNHPHILQGMREYKGKLICYSLGNFCYGGSKNPEDQDSGIFQQTFTFVDGVLQPKLDARFIPCRLSGTKSRNDYQPTPVTGKEAGRILEKLNGYSEIFDFQWQEDGTYLREDPQYD